MALKVFSWLHQKLHAREDYCVISKKDEIKEDVDVVRESAAERDTEALLLHDILLNGILTIGTLGHEQSFLPDDQGLPDEEEKEQTLQNDDQGEKTQPELEPDQTPALLAATDSTPVSRVGSLKMNSASMKVRECSEIVEVSVTKTEIEEYRVSIQEKPLLMNVEKREETMMIKPRITLAELFAADVFAPTDSEEVEEEKGDLDGKKLVRPDQVKLCHEVKMEKNKEKLASKSAHTLNRLIRKMLRKKIHPEHPSRRADEGPLIMHAHPTDISTN